MCGICGVLSLDGAPVPHELPEAMMALLAHRGPDGDGVFVDGPVAFGHRRLSIIDPAGGHQPLANADRTVCVTYNGEVYNFPDLVAELQGLGHRFATRCDTEVLVHGYEAWGLDLLARLNGMYAFGLWDARRHRLILARDPFGIKPLYYWCDGRRLLFASEIKAFLADPTFDRALDPVGLDQYLTYQFVPSPRTIFRDVAKLRPGHALVVEHGRLIVHPFEVRPPTIQPVADEREAVEVLRARLEAAVRRQMISDVPIGALLSGGVDSATVTALMTRLTGQPVRTFTVGFSGQFDKNELAPARRTAEILGTDHHEVVIGARECMDSLSDVVWQLDEPIANSSALAMYWLSRLAARHVKVVLTGQGADEPWAGYRRYRGERLGVWYRRLPGPLRTRVAAPLIGLLPRAEAAKRAAFALSEPDPARRFSNVYAGFTPSMKRQLYRDPVVQDDADPIQYWQAIVSRQSPLAQQLWVETRFSLADNLLAYGDKMSMASSLEARVPLLDLELMRFVESLPTALRLHGWTGHKYLLRKAITAWLPDEILRRPKIGFATPMDAWLQREVAATVGDRLTSPGTACERYFNPDYIRQLIREHVARTEDHTRVLMTLLIFEFWHHTFVESLLPTTRSLNRPPVLA